MQVRNTMGANEGKQLKYFQLMEDLKAKILAGEIHAGDKLPSENELSAQYQISRQTVRKALSMLQNAGYIYAEHGRGTFCSEMVRHVQPSKNIAVVTTYLSGICMSSWKNFIFRMSLFRAVFHK